MNHAKMTEPIEMPFGEGLCGPVDYILDWGIHMGILLDDLCGIPVEHLLTIQKVAGSNLGRSAYTFASVTKQYNLVPASW